MRHRDIIGTRVAITDYAEVLDEIDAAIAERRKIYVCCAPASSLVNARRDPELRAALDSADIVTPDGMGVVYAARLLGEKIGDRVYGPDLMLAQCERAASSGQRIWLYGGFDRDALDALRSSLEQRFAHLEIAGGHSPPHRELSADERDEIVRQINDSATDVVWVGLGSPKQEIWMHEERDRLEAPVLCGVGAAFDFHAGRVTQAPAWMQRAGLEWLFRVLADPRRLAKRYVATLPRFVVSVFSQRMRGLDD